MSSLFTISKETQKQEHNSKMAEIGILRVSYVILSV
jgi:hypothetical protein